jgi:hypothetical protein
MTNLTAVQNRALIRLKGLEKFISDEHADTLANTPATFRSKVGERDKVSVKAWVALPEAERRERILARLEVIETESEELRARFTAVRNTPPSEPASAAAVAHVPNAVVSAPIDAPQPVDASDLAGAYVACAGGCGAWVPSRSTYKPALSICSSTRRQISATTCAAERV